MASGRGGLTALRLVVAREGHGLERADGRTGTRLWLSLSGAWKIFRCSQMRNGLCHISEEETIKPTQLEYSFFKRCMSVELVMTTK